MSSGQNGKGSKRRPATVSDDEVAANWARIFRKPITCDICGRFVSNADLESGAAVRHLDTPDSDYSTESYETYHTACANPKPDSPASDSVQPST